MAPNTAFCSHQPHWGPETKPARRLCPEQLGIREGQSLQCWVGVQACPGLPPVTPKCPQGQSCQEPRLEGPSQCRGQAPGPRLPADSHLRALGWRPSSTADQLRDQGQRLPLRASTSSSAKWAPPVEMGIRSADPWEATRKRRAPERGGWGVLPRTQSHTPRPDASRDSERNSEAPEST